MTIIDQIKLSFGWRRTRALLHNAFAMITSTSTTPEVGRYLAEYRDMLDHNELECAMNMLEQAGDSLDMGSQFWEHLAAAAESMELTREGERFRQHAHSRRLSRSTEH